MVPVLQLSPRRKQRHRERRQQTSSKKRQPDHPSPKPRTSLVPTLSVFYLVNEVKSWGEAARMPKGGRLGVTQGREREQGDCLGNLLEERCLRRREGTGQGKHAQGQISGASRS